MSTINISCPNCAATNRIPEGRLGDGPTCGKCKKPLFKGKVMELSAANVAATLNHNPGLLGVGLVEVLHLFLSKRQRSLNQAYVWQN